MNLNFDTKLTTQNHKIDVSLSESNQTIGSVFSDVVQIPGSSGTVTSVSVQMNGEIKGTVEDSGIIDLGTVITEHQDISGKQNIATLEEDITNLGFTKNTGTYIKPDNGIPKSDLDPSIQEILDKADSAEWNSITGKPFNAIDNNSLKVENNILRVNTVDEANPDYTQPITSRGVNTIVGNIQALLELI